MSQQIYLEDGRLFAVDDSHEISLEEIDSRIATATGHLEELRAQRTLAEQLLGQTKSAEPSQPAETTETPSQTPAEPQAPEAAGAPAQPQSASIQPQQSFDANGNPVYQTAPAQPAQPTVPQGPSPSDLPAFAA
jgi:hypothetical protein